MVEIKLSEEEKNLFIKVSDMFNLLRGNLSGRKLRRKVLQVFFDKVLQFIKENPGVLQRSLYEGFFRNNKHLLSAFFI